MNNTNVTAESITLAALNTGRVLTEKQANQILDRHNQLTRQNYNEQEDN